jgi:hypothetical protein
MLPATHDTLNFRVGRDPPGAAAEALSVQPLSLKEGITARMRMDGFLATRVQFDSAARQFRTIVMGASVDVSLIIRNRPSGAMSQLIGPVRIPVSTMPVWNNGCGLPDLKTGLVVTSTAIIWESGEM